MSEQIIRAIASDYKANHNLEQSEPCHCILCAGLRAALSEPPDVVVLLRWLHAMLQTKRNREMEKALCWMKDRIELQFHARLTDDGWEWVEDGEEAEGEDWECVGDIVAQGPEHGDFWVEEEGGC